MKLTENTELFFTQDTLQSIKIKDIPPSLRREILKNQEDAEKLRNWAEFRKKYYSKEYNDEVTAGLTILKKNDEIVERLKKRIKEIKIPYNTEPKKEIDVGELSVRTDLYLMQELQKILGEEK